MYYMWKYRMQGEVDVAIIGSTHKAQRETDVSQLTIINRKYNVIAFFQSSVEGKKIDGSHQHLMIYNVFKSFHTMSREKNGTGL